MNTFTFRVTVAVPDELIKEVADRHDANCTDPECERDLHPGEHPGDNGEWLPLVIG